MQCRLRRSGGTATCKTVDRRDCAPHTVMRAGRPRTRHAHGSIMLHFTRVRMSLSPLASCLSPLASRLIPSRPSPLASRLLPLAPRLSPHPLSPLASLVSRLLPHPLSPHPLATVPAAGPGAAPLRPSTLSSHVQRATCNLQPLSPRPLRHCPRCRSGRNAAAPLRRPAALPPRAASPRHCPRCRYGRNAAAPLHVVVPRATCNVQPSTPLASSPSPLSPLPVRAQRRCALPRCRPTCNVQRSTFNPSRLAPLPSRLARDGATKPSTDRKPVSPRIAIRRPPM